MRKNQDYINVTIVFARIDTYIPEDCQGYCTNPSRSWRGEHKICRKRQALKLWRRSEIVPISTGGMTI